MKTIKYLFNQAWLQLKQQPLLTVVSVFGTALTICLIMVMVMQHQIKVIPFAPESNRARLLHVKWVSLERKVGEEYKVWSNGPLGYKAATACFKDLKSAEDVSFYSIIYRPMQIKRPLGASKSVDVKQTDASFFKILDFAFIDGKPFMNADSDAGLPVAVVSESVAKSLFDTAAASGKEVLINDAPYRIVGVVKDVSSLASTAYAQVWIPYLSTDITTSDQFSWVDGNLGMFSVVILAKDKKDFDAIREESSRKLATHNASMGAYRIFFRGEPDDQLTMTQHKWSYEAPDMQGYFRNLFIFALILLLVPAINLSSMTQSRLRQRVAEIGVRRSFGATRGAIIGQIIAENLVLTLVAGFVGLLLCFTFASIWGSSLFAKAQLVTLNIAPAVEWQMLFNLSTFIYALLFSLLLNVLSSGIPAWKASKISIVQALTGKTH